MKREAAVGAVIGALAVGVAGGYLIGQASEPPTDEERVWCADDDNKDALLGGLAVLDQDTAIAAFRAVGVTGEGGVVTEYTERQRDQVISELIDNHEDAYWRACGAARDAAR